VDLRRALGRLRHRHPLGERHPPAIARGTRPTLSRGGTGRDVAGCAERELVGSVLGLAGRAALGRPALGPHGPGGAARSVTSRVLQPIWGTVRDPEPVAVFGAEQLRVTVSVTVAVGFPIGFPVPVPHPLADGFSDSLPLGDRYYPAADHDAADDPAAYHDATDDATTHDDAADDPAAYHDATDDATTHDDAAYYAAADDDTGAVLGGAFGAARFGVVALFIVRIVWRVLFGEVRWTVRQSSRLTSRSGIGGLSV
jgi:hypothetical protein